MRKTDGVTGFGRRGTPGGLFAPFRRSAPVWRVDAPWDPAVATVEGELPLEHRPPRVLRVTGPGEAEAAAKVLPRYATTMLP